MVSSQVSSIDWQSGYLEKDSEMIRSPRTGRYAGGVLYLSQGRSRGIVTVSQVRCVGLWTGRLMCAVVSSSPVGAAQSREEPQLSWGWDPVSSAS